MRDEPLVEEGPVLHRQRPAVKRGKYAAMVSPQEPAKSMYPAFVEATCPSASVSALKARIAHLLFLQREAQLQPHQDLRGLGSNAQDAPNPRDDL